MEILHSATAHEQVLARSGRATTSASLGGEDGARGARAKTVVRTLAVRRDQAPRLQEVLRSAGQLVAESGHFPVSLRAGPRAPA